MSVMRVFGPVNSGYSTGMMAYTEKSDRWDHESELVDGYLNNMGAAYGDEENWGGMQKDLFASALSETDVVIQPRQSNTWGPLSLDHVYEFMGGLSLTVKTLTGKEPDALMADYRNRNNKRMQNINEAIAVEARATVLNPTFVKERMKGGATTAQMFGEIFRNIFGWHATRPSAMDKEIFNDLYKMYIVDESSGYARSPSGRKRKRKRYRIERGETHENGKPEKECGKWHPYRRYCPFSIRWSNIPAET